MTEKVEKCSYIATYPDLDDRLSEALQEIDSNGNSRCSELAKCSTSLAKQIESYYELRSTTEYINGILTAVVNDYQYKNLEYFKSVLFEEIGFSRTQSFNTFVFEDEITQDLEDEFYQAGRLNGIIDEQNDGKPFRYQALRDKTQKAVDELESGRSPQQLSNLEIKTLKSILVSLDNTIKLLKNIKRCAKFIVKTEEDIKFAIRRDIRSRSNIVNIALGTQDPEDAKKNASGYKALSEGVGKGIIFADKAIYQEQCFLLSQLTTLIELKRKDHTPRLPYVLKTSPVKMSEIDILAQEGEFRQETETIDSNAPILIYDEPFGFINRLTQAPYSKNLFNLTTDKLSSLVPMIKLYKVQTDPGTGKDVGYVEIKFDTNPAVKSYAGGKSALDLFSSSKKRGVGVGLKNFNFTFHGSDPFAAKKAIQAKVSIFATSFGDLIQDRRGDYTAVSEDFKGDIPIANYKFADLALKTGRTPEDLRTNMSSIQKDNLDKLNFRLKVVMGWAIPQNYLSTFTKSEKEAINDSFININLTPTTHEFSFDEMGGVVFDINYLAYIEDYFNNSMFNIFSSPGIEGNRIGRKLFYEFLNNENCESDVISNAKEKDAQFIQQEKGQSFARIITQLNKQKKILYYNLNYEQISEFLRTGKMPKGVPEPTNDNGPNVQKLRDQFKKALSSVEKDNKDKIGGLQVSLVSNSRNSNKISFFYISDLIDVIMQNIEESLETLTSELKDNNKEALNYYDEAQLSSDFSSVKKEYEEFLEKATVTETINYNDGTRAIIAKKTSVAKEIEKLMKAKEQFKKLRIVLGPMEVKDPFDENKMSFCSIGDIPISLNYFTEFLTEKVLSKDQAYYPITNFIKDITNELIRNFINNDSCFAFNTKQRVRLNSSVITGFKRAENKTDTDDISYFIKRNPKTIGVGGIFNLSDPRARAIKPVINVSGPSRFPMSMAQPNREINYYVFYAGRSYPVGKMTGNEQDDAENGIFHYILGKDRGVVKNISLDRTDMTGLKELRFEQEGFDGLTQLREVYNANIDCLLNLHTFPGTYIYVDPRGFSPEMTKDKNGNDFTQFGIGGYYMITRSEHSIGPGKADTKITAKWVADTGGGNADNNSRKPTIDDSQDKPKKCATSKRKSSLKSNNPSNTASDAVNEINKRSGGTGWLYGSPGRKA